MHTVMCTFVLNINMRYTNHKYLVVYSVCKWHFRKMMWTRITSCCTGPVTFRPVSGPVKKCRFFARPVNICLKPVKILQNRVRPVNILKTWFKPVNILKTRVKPGNILKTQISRWISYISVYRLAFFYIFEI